jgi:nitronate monooxygenase
MFDRLEIPIIQAPMLGATTGSIAIAVSRIGALGSFAAAGSSPEAIRSTVAEIRAATDRPFSVNLFVQTPVNPKPGELRVAMSRIASWRERYGLTTQAIPNKWAEAFEPQFEALLDVAPPVASFTFGILTRPQTRALRARGVFVVGTATTVAEAKAWVEAGADAICAQGFEAGGHRGAFLDDPAINSVGTFALIRTIVRAVKLPVIAAGGITDGAGVASALMLGASAAQIGTAYLLSDESIISAPWKRAIETAADDPTRLTRAITGRHARGIDNEFIRKMRATEDDVPAYPVQNALTQELRAAAAKAGSTNVLSLWAGQGVKLARKGKAADITRDIWDDARETLRGVADKWAGP